MQRSDDGSWHVLVRVELHSDVLEQRVELPFLAGKSVEPLFESRETVKDHCAQRDHEDPESDRGFIHGPASFSCNLPWTEDDCTASLERLAMASVSEPGVSLQRRFGLLQATALNMSNMIGIGPFITIPLLMTALGGPQALLGWLVALLVTIPDGLVWSELGAAMPGSGGSYIYLREGYGKERYGRLMAFLFIWSFILSGPLEIASGYIGFSRYARYIWPDLTSGHVFLIAAGVGLLNVVLLYRRIEAIGTLTVSLWIGTLLTTVAVIASGALNFDAGARVRLSPGRVRFLAGLPDRPGRRLTRRHLRLPRLLRHLLHRRRSQGSRSGHPSLDHDQHRRGRRDLHRDQPLDHRRHPVA